MKKKTFFLQNNELSVVFEDQKTQSSNIITSFTGYTLRYGCSLNPLD